MTTTPGHPDGAALDVGAGVLPRLQALYPSLFAAERRPPTTSLPTRGEAMASRIAHLNVVDALYVAAALRIDGAVERIRKSVSVIAEKRI